MAERAGFWRRLFALIVDSLIVGVAMIAATLVLFPLTHGRVQSNGFVLAHTQCWSATKIPAGIIVPDSFAPNVAADCVGTLFDHTVSRAFTVGRVTSLGTKGATWTTAAGFMLDDERQPVRGLMLDLLWLPFFLLLRWSTDLVGGSPGRLLMGLRVSAVDADQVAAGALARRYAIFALPFLPSSSIALYFSFSLYRLALLDSSAYLPIMAGVALVGLVPMIVAVVAIVRRRDAFYDRAARTMVVLKRSPAHAAGDTSAAT